MKRQRQTPWLAGVIATLVVFATVKAVRMSGSLQTLELSAYDQFVRWRPHDIRLASTIALVVLDEPQIQEIHQSVLTDSTLCDLLESLLAGGARVIGLDIYRDFPVPAERSDEQSEDWDRLNTLLREHPDIVTVAKFAEPATADRPFEVRPPPGSMPSRFGLNDQLVDDEIDGKLRRTLLACATEDSADSETLIYPSFAMQVACNYLGMTLDPLDYEWWSAPKLGETTLRLFESNDGAYVRADASGYQILHDFKGPRDFSGQMLRVADVVAGRFSRDLVQDKIVLIGVRSTSVKDDFATPINPRIFGIELHATQVDQLLRIAHFGSRPTAVWPDAAEAAWLLLWSGVGGVLGLLIRAPLRSLSAAALALVILMAVGFLLFRRGWWVPLVPPSLAMIASAALITSYIAFREQQEWAALMRLFGTHVSKPVADEIWQHRELLLQGGRLLSREIFATVLFTDLQGFTAASRTMPPGEVMRWLNQYMEAMTRAVMKHGGFVNKYTGDGLMAIFGAPVPSLTQEQQRSDAMAAVRCALEMRHLLMQLRSELASAGVAELRMRVGIYSGPLVAGSVGGAGRLEYTVIGDTVNTASRFESYAKDDPLLRSEAFSPGGCRILVGGPTQQYLDGQFQTKFIREDELIGRAGTKVAIYAVLSDADGGSVTERQGSS